MTSTATQPAASVTPAAPTEAGHNRGHFGYKPALDGLRAIAVLSVFAYHLDFGWAKGGFLGVDMFFVLSGYLITSLLLIEWGANGSIRFGAFWARRARRLLPAVFVVLIAVAIWGRIVLPSSEWGSLRADSLWTLFYGANWHFIWAGQSYFSPNPSPLRHAWSLAIEEQFYLVWPLVVYAAMRLSKGRIWLIASVAALGIAGSLYALESHFTPGADPSRSYYGTDARASQMLVGALLGMLLLRWNPVARVSRVVLQAGRRSRPPSSSCGRSPRPTTPVAACTTAASSPSRSARRSSSPQWSRRPATRSRASSHCGRCAGSAPCPTASTSGTGRSSCS